MVRAERVATVAVVAVRATCINFVCASKRPVIFFSNWLVAAKQRFCTPSKLCSLDSAVSMVWW